MIGFNKKNIRVYKPIGAAPWGQFCFGGKLGILVWVLVMIRGLRISEKKEILRKLILL